MSTQRNTQKSLVSSAPANSAPKKYAHTCEIHSEEPKRRCEYQPNSVRSSIQSELLLLEDFNGGLLQNNCQALSSSDSISTTASTPCSAIEYNQSFYRVPEDLLARGDFIAYQSADIADFFNSTTNNHARPQRVSEICLVNDHYIFVQLPEPQFGYSSRMDTIVEEEGSKTDNCERGKGFLRYFPCQRNRRVLPAGAVERIKESAESATTEKKRSIPKCPLAHCCWRVNESPEIFESRTKIFGVLWKQKIPAKVITIQPTKSGMEAPLDLRIKSVRIPESCASVAENNNQVDTGIFGSPLNSPSKATPLPVVGGALQTSMHDAITLEQHANWVNGDKIDLMQNVAEKKFSSVVDGKNTKAKRRRNLFHWLPKRSKAPKPKSKIHAVIYKTYFVRWKKPPDEMCPHCGCLRNDESSTVASCKWRRCHSATF
ncbi:uncharacterized protein LOC128863201 [Anastrepha ludens]|uniref:uncharacterized protein LOC128863201 n=1 Tax=Anastrepha ludens TaxID=28586 RepID=UPI0023AF5391|nr:uncharacterized protein LOC128863201 [Anastrepha ludens]XP_053958201.1 uncharacterized protein LOC128863201 [Anastrepha ludens]